MAVSDRPPRHRNFDEWHQGEREWRTISGQAAFGQEEDVADAAVPNSFIGTAFVRPDEGGPTQLDIGVVIEPEA